VAPTAVALPVVALEVLDTLGLLLLTVPVVVILGAVWDSECARGVVAVYPGALGGRSLPMAGGPHGSGHALLRSLLADTSATAIAGRPSLVALERKLAVLHRMIELALRRGDWETAARLEEQAIVTEHRAALLREGLLAIFGDT
jgi:hypothetical protein